MKRLEITEFPALSPSTNEAINTLCTNIFYSGDDIRSILFTSRYEQEGKSNISINVASTFSLLGKRVVLVDADLRKSSLAKRYRFRYKESNPQGLAQYLAGMCPIQDSIYETNLRNLSIIPSGKDVRNSLRLLASEKFDEMMEQLHRDYDFVIIDTPPAGVIVDAIQIAGHCDSAIIVVSYNIGHKQEIRSVAQQLARTGCKVLGAVMNNVKMETLRNRKYYYRSMYRSYDYKYYRHRSTGTD